MRFVDGDFFSLAGHHPIHTGKNSMIRMMHCFFRRARSCCPAIGLLPLMPLAAAVSALPFAEGWLPTNTIGYVTVPNFPASKAGLMGSPLGRLWSDSSMAAFRSQVTECILSNGVAPWQNPLSIDFRRWLPLLRGQVTLAWFPLENSNSPAWGALIDTSGQEAAMGRELEGLRTRWTSAGFSLKTNVFTGIEFVAVSGWAREATASSNLTPNKSVSPESLWFGWRQNVLLIAEARSAAAALAASLSPTGTTAATNRLRFPAATAQALPGIFGWLDFTAIRPLLDQKFAGLFGMLASLGGQPAQVGSALGLDTLRQAAFSAVASEVGIRSRAFLDVPAAHRSGIFQLLAFDPREASPLSSVPAEALRFQRGRVNGARMWKTLEESLNQVSPQMSGLLRLTLETAGQSVDERFSVTRNIAEALGDDFMTYELPVGTNVASGGRVTLLGSPRPAALLVGVRALLTLAMIEGGGEFSERLFLGQTLHRIAVPAADGEPAHLLEIGVNGRYVIIADQPSVLEELLRRTDDPANGLRSVPRVVEAARDAGGWDRGLFAYEDVAKAGARRWEAMRVSGLESAPLAVAHGLTLMAPAVAGCLDFTRLPPFEKIARYQRISVLTGGTDTNGFRFEWLSQ
ncbi:MAG: hypothetical protein EXS36_09750 [Pedosphaera sp.]|nr:hypothetical protein [Pedosphaera sp.]